MQAITFSPSTDQFSISEKTVPEIQSDEILVQVKACGINPVDAKVSGWKNMSKKMTEQFVTGLDVAGVVKEKGTDVSEFNIGDEVFYHGNMLEPNGGFAEYAVQKANMAFYKPKEFSFIEIAATPCAGWTAWRAIHEKLAVEPNDIVVINGATGGVGSYALQIAKNVGYAQTVIGVCSSKHEDYALQLGADATIDYHTEDVEKRLKELTLETGITKAFDIVGNNNDIALANSLAFNGHLVELVDYVQPTQYDNAFLKSLTLHQLSLGGGYSFGEAGHQSIRKAGIQFTTALIQGDILLPKITPLNWEQTILKLNNILSGGNIGKFVFTP